MTRADFRVRLRGRNFLLADDSTVRRWSFDVTVFVQATDVDEARTRAMQAIATDEDLRSAVRNPEHDPPLVFTLEAARIPAELAPPPKRSAFTFAPDDGSEPEPGLAPQRA